jgi:arginine N-succinyltransferase
MAPGYEIRAATPEHLEGLSELARHLNTVNLPDDPVEVKAILERSERAFSGEIKSPSYREYVFVLRDRDKDRIVGTSMIIGQVGRKDAPHIYFNVRTEEKYSAKFDRHFAHQVLSIGYSFRGPTEIGGLVVHPEHRRSPEKLGRLISYVRPPSWGRWKATW